MDDSTFMERSAKTRNYNESLKKNITIVSEYVRPVLSSIDFEDGRYDVLSDTTPVSSAHNYQRRYR